MKNTLASLKVNLNNTFPPVMYRLLNEAVKDEPDFPAIARTIGMDPSLTVSVLNLVNSPFYGLGQKIVDLRRAAVVLGVEEILKLALSVSFHQNMVKNSQATERAFASWRMLVWAAVAAELIAQTHCPDSTCHIYLCALLKDLSLIALEQSAPERFVSWGDAPLLCPLPGQTKTDQRIMGTDHARMTYELLAELGLDSIDCDCLLNHHDMEGVTYRAPADQCLILATRWSEVEMGCSRDPQQLLHFEAICRRILGLNQDAMDDLRSKIAMRFSSMLATLGIAEAPPGSQFYRHSLFEIQRANFLSSPIANPPGGHASVIAILHRILTLTFNLAEWELALLGPHKRSWHIFSCQGNELDEAKRTGPASEPIPWEMAGEIMYLRATGTQYGALLVAAKPKGYSADSLHLQLKFAAHAYENYLLRQANLETKASTLDHLPIGVARLDPSGNLLGANDQFFSYFPFPHGGEAHQTFETIREILGEEAGHRLQAFLDNDEKSTSKLFFISSPDGQEHLLYSSLHRQEDGSGDVLILGEDITEISAVEVQSLKQLGFLNALVGSMRDIVLTVDTAGLVTYASPNAPQSLVGQNLFAIAVSTSETTPLPGADRLEEMSGPYEVQLPLSDRQTPLELVFSPLLQKGQTPQFLVVGRDLTVIRRLEDELRRKAIYDGLTGLLNHSQFQTVLDRELGRARRTNTSVGLIFMDLDGFKQINDTKGHMVGDNVLRKVGRILRKACRKGSMDYPCRYGGDEFAIIYTQVDENFLETAYRRLAVGFKKEFGDDIGFSAGLALAASSEQSAELLRRTDRATYKAKSRGGRQFAWADPPSAPSADEK